MIIKKFNIFNESKKKFNNLDDVIYSGKVYTLSDLMEYTSKQSDDELSNDCGYYLGLNPDRVSFAMDCSPSTRFNYQVKLCKKLMDKLDNDLSNPNNPFKIS